MKLRPILGRAARKCALQKELRRPNSWRLKTEMANSNMTEYYTIKRIDNSRLVRTTAPARLREFWRRVGVGSVMAALLLCYAWQHFQCIQTRYQVEQLESQRARAAELNQQLRLEVATLRSPMRVDTIARQQLGLTVPVPAQVAPVEGPSEAVLAEARAGAPPSRP